VLDEHGSDIQIAVQTGRANEWHYQLIRAHFNDPEAAESVDLLVVHQFPWTFGGADHLADHVEQSLDDWRAMPGIDDDAGLYLSGWNINSSSRGADQKDWGLDQAPAMLELATTFMIMGTEAAALYGVQNPDGGRLTAWEGNDTILPAGHMYQMMSDSLLGTQVLDISAENQPGGDNDGTGYALHAFEDDAKFVIFVSARHEPGQDSDDVQINLDDLGIDFTHVWATRLTAEADGADTPDAVAQTEDFVPEHDSEDGTISLTFSQNSEVIRLIIAKDDPGEGYLHLRGDDSDDILITGLSDDLIEGLGGDDIMRGGAGADTYIGGSGSDTVDYLGSSGVHASLANGVNNTSHAAGDTYDSVENLSGSHLGDRLVGDEGDNVLTGRGGYDRLIGGDGDDFIAGGDGFDRIVGGNGDDAIGAGHGSDHVQGRDGDDTIFGGTGHDRLQGGAGDDILRGGKGADWLEGGSGDDDMAGGAGKDTFRIGVENGQDVIRDFSVGEDRLELSQDLFDGIDGLIDASTDTKEGVLIDTGLDMSIFLQGLTIEDLAALQDEDDDENEPDLVWF
jgi:Ca2+-binding RTX toxin-like protein